MALAVLAAAFLLAPMRTLAATPGGDCDKDGETSIVELQGCVNLFLSGDSPSICAECDVDGDGEVSITDLQGAVNCFLDATVQSCPMVVGGESPTPTAPPTAVPTTPAAARCGDGVKNGAEECDDGAACFTGSEPGKLCATDNDCPGGGAGSCRPFGGDGCANNCTNEKILTYVFSGALCRGGAKNGQLCKFNSFCVGGTKPGRICTAASQCGGGECVSECGADSSGCFGDGECVTAGPGVSAGAACPMNFDGTATKFCVGGPSPGKLCSADAECGTGGTCPGFCGVGGVCENKSRSGLISLGISIKIGPMIGQSKVRFGSANANGTIPVATHLGDTQFDPVRVPGLVCACVSGGEDPAAHGPGNNGSGLINCGANPIANVVTLAQDHNTTTPNICVNGPFPGKACTPVCAAGGPRANMPCTILGSNSPDCPGTVSSQKTCRDTTECTDLAAPLVQGQCNINNGPGRCVGGPSVGRACLNSTQCGAGGNCVGKCIKGNVGAACNCDATSRGCDNTTQCGASGYCRVTGQGGGFCMGPPRFCVNGPTPGKACFNATECGTGGTCPGTGSFLAYCDSHDDCPGSFCNSIDDASCTQQDPLPPAGSGAVPCKESRSFCTAGPRLGAPCTASNECGANGTCGNTCNAASNHPGVCNSPAHIELSGANGAGHALFLNTIAIGTISDGGACSLAAVCVGGVSDGQACVIPADCPNGSCATAQCSGTCAGGSAAGNRCLANSDCPTSTCTPGANFKQPCTGDGGCNGSVCQPVNLAKGLDGLPCTSDDAVAARGRPQTIPQTTARASALIADVGNVPGSQLVHQNCVESSNGLECVTSVQGSPFNCANLQSATPSASGLRLVNAFPSLDGQTGDAVVTTFLSAR